MDQPSVVNEETLTPLRITYGVCALAVAAATFILGLSARIDSVEAKSRTTADVVNEIKRDDSEDRKVWVQDRIDNANFKGEVREALKRIEKKL